jgi:hypothetical protein
MTSFVDLDRCGRAAFFNGHGHVLVAGRDQFIAAAGAYYDTLKSQCAFEGPSPAREDFISDQLDRAHGRCAQEIRDYLVW